MRLVSHPFLIVLAAASLFAVGTLSGCGVLIGNVKPVDEKSEAYGVMDLSKESPEWRKLDPQETGDGEKADDDEELSGRSLVGGPTGADRQARQRHAERHEQHESPREADAGFWRDPHKSSSLLFVAFGRQEASRPAG